ncbi:MAG: hypothetical protein J6A81_06185 [Peptococcaceae bacterium]|nr:hypothetical protein [Peptococcaceae bacterium]
METTLQLILNELKTMNHRMDTMESHMSSMENRMGSMESRMDSIENRLSSVEENLSGLTAQVKEHNTLLKTALDNYSRMENKIDSVFSMLYSDDFR